MARSLEIRPETTSLIEGLGERRHRVKDWMAGGLKLPGRAVKQANRGRATRGSQAEKRSSSAPTEMMTSLWGTGRRHTLYMCLALACHLCDRDHDTVLSRSEQDSRKAETLVHPHLAVCLTATLVLVRLAAWRRIHGRNGVVPGGVRLVPIDLLRVPRKTRILGNPLMQSSHLPHVWVRPTGWANNTL